MLFQRANTNREVFGPQATVRLVEDAWPVSTCAVEERRNFRDVVEDAEGVTLSNEALARAFDTDRLLAHRGRFLDALTWRE